MRSARALSIMTVLMLSATALAGESLVNGGLEQGNMGGWNTRDWGSGGNLHDPPRTQCACGPHDGQHLTAAEGQYFGGLTYVQNTTPNATNYIKLRQIVDVKHWTGSATRTRFDLEAWVNLAVKFDGPESWKNGFVSQEYNLIWMDDGSGIEGYQTWWASRQTRIAYMDSTAFMKSTTAPNWTQWRKLKVSGSMPIAPRQVILEIRLGYNNNPPDCHNCFDGVVFSAEAVNDPIIGPFAGDIPNSDFEQEPFNTIHWYQQPAPPTGWNLFHDFEATVRGPIEAYTNGVTTPTNPLGITAPSGQHFWGRVFDPSDLTRGQACQGSWGHVVPVRNWSPHATALKWKLHYWTKFWHLNGNWGYNGNPTERFQLCWNAAGTGLVQDPPANPYQDSRVTGEIYFPWLEIVNLDGSSMQGVTDGYGESKPWRVIERTGEFPMTNADGTPGCPQYVLLRNGTSADAGGSRANRFQILYDKVDFVVEAVGGCATPSADLDGDGDVDQDDFGLLQACITPTSGGLDESCWCADLNRDGTHVNDEELSMFLRCVSGPAIPADPDCEHQACCLGNGVCQDLSPNECLAQNGTLRGAGSTCASVVCP